jgi:carboxyl-terminal processing protease
MMQRCSRFSLFVACALALAGSLAFARPAQVDARTTEANVARVTASLLASSQLSHHPLDKQLAGKLLERYLDALDPGRSVLLKSDEAEFGAAAARLADSLRAQGDTGAAHTIFARYLERLRQKVAFQAGLLRAGQFTFDGRDRFAFDRTHAERPADRHAAEALWTEEVRAEVLAEKLADKPAPGGPANALIRRHEQELKNISKLNDNDVLEMYLDALAHVYDPHSDYLGTESMESLSIAMKLSLSGIGATLANEDGTCTVRELVPGGPAAQSGALKPGDRIVAVAQGSGAPVDVTAMPLSRMVELIRGPKGSPVTLTVLPPAGSPGGARSVRLLRAEVQLRDQKAKARLVDLPRPKGPSMRLGVIDLPSFYAGQRPDGATHDVKLLLDKLKAEHVRGVVLDLRRNGGGSLEEAVAMTGLFIPRGPVVETRDSTGAVDVGSDLDPAVAYDGPLVVLTSRFSASASEIVAGALQDYGRAVIAGDSSTFGKGTVQTLVELGPLMDRAGLGHASNPGALKLTVSKFYRPSGGSTELRGVTSDVVIASPTEAAPISEAKLADPLPWDSIPATRYDRVDQVGPYLQALRAGARRRTTANATLRDLRQEVDLLVARASSGSISLNEAERRHDEAEDKRVRDAVAAEVRRTAASTLTYEIRVDDAGHPGLPLPLRAASLEPSDRGGSPAAAVDRRSDQEDASAGSTVEQLVLNQALEMLADYVDLRAAPARST